MEITERIGSAYRRYARTIEDNAGGRFVMISNEVSA